MSEKQLSDKIDQSYQTAVHIAYAIVLTQTFEIVSKMFISPSNFLSNPNNYSIIHLPPVLLSYAVFVTSWIGYIRSVSNHGYKDGVRGTARFLTDLFIVFLIYELLNSVNIDNKIDYFDIFLLLPIIFVVYVVWDFLKFSEHFKKNHRDNLAHIHRVSITLNYTSLFLILTLSYLIIPIVLASYNQLIASTPYVNLINWKQQIETQDDLWWNSICMVFAIIFTVFYRRAKWQNTYRKKSRRVRG